MYQLCCDGLKQDLTVQLLYSHDDLFPHMPSGNKSKEADSSDRATSTRQTDATSNQHGMGELDPFPKLPQPFHPVLLTLPIKEWPCPSPEHWADIQAAVNQAFILYFWLISDAQRARQVAQHADEPHRFLVFYNFKLMAALIAGKLRITVMQGGPQLVGICCL